MPPFFPFLFSYSLYISNSLAPLLYCFIHSVLSSNLFTKHTHVIRMYVCVPGGLSVHSVYIYIYCFCCTQLHVSGWCVYVVSPLLFLTTLVSLPVYQCSHLYLWLPLSRICLLSSLYYFSHFWSLFITSSLFIFVSSSPNYVYCVSAKYMLQFFQFYVTFLFSKHANPPFNFLVLLYAFSF